MSSKYKQPNIASSVRFEKSPIADLEYSKMRVAPKTFTTYNAGDIVPIRCIEVLPHTTMKMSVDVINRLLSPITVPTMGAMQMDIYAFFSSIREVNDSWKNVLGENSSEYWTAPEVDLVPLYALRQTSDVKIPIGSIADYYGLPTQRPIKAEVLHNMSDTVFRQYAHIVNNYFRDQNYQPPIAFSKLNVYQGFLKPTGSVIPLDPESDNLQIPVNVSADGSAGLGAVVKGVYGEGVKTTVPTYGGGSIGGRVTNWSALDKPFKANKLHDEFTSALPSPQRGQEVYFGVAESAPVIGAEEMHSLELPYRFQASFNNGTGGVLGTGVSSDGKLGTLKVAVESDSFVGDGYPEIKATNLIADLSKVTGISVNDLRRSAAIQQIYEQLARGGARYREFLKSFFGLDVENVFKDIPTQLGHARMELDMYQVAQTSGGEEQGTLAGYGYTDKKDYLFDYTALEHGFIHIFAIVRQQNIYSSLVNPFWFRRSTLDWYYPQLANIGEQPMRLALLNPFVADSMEKAVGFQEAWYEYRYESDVCSGYCRTGLTDSNGNEVTLGSWTYADDFDLSFTHVNGDWLRSNAQEVLDRTLAVTSEVSPQFIACFTFDIEKEIPMPTYSVPGMDII